MTNISIDEIINKLSSKFNRIFYDREFVGSVCEDFQTIIKNENKCVLVFPVLSPNYLRVVRYQAKLFDLAVFTLGSRSARSVGVCNKKYCLPPAEPEENFKPDNPCTKLMAENPATSTRKKRPPIQLYIPPAQRRSRLSEKSNFQKENTKSVSQKISNRCDSEKFSLTKINGSNEVKKERHIDISALERGIKKAEVQKESLLCGTNGSRIEKELQNKEFYLCLDDLDYLLPNQIFTFPFFIYPCNCMKFLLSKDVFPNAELLVFSVKRIKHSFHCIRLEQKAYGILTQVDNYLERLSIINTERPLFRNIRNDIRICLFGPNMLDFRETFHFIKEFSEFQNTYYLCGDIIFELPKYNYCCYLPVPQYQVFDDDLKPYNYLHSCQNNENMSILEEFIKSITNCILLLPLLPKTEDLDLENSLLELPSRRESPQMPCEKDDDNYCDNKNVDICAKPGYTNELKNSIPEEQQIYKQIDNVIVLDDHVHVPTKTGTKSLPRTSEKDEGKNNEHEQEKEIMRRTKQNINRKTRPIIKYVDDDNDTLKIGKGDNVNNWEDLFNDDGELQEDIFTEIIHKVGPEVTIVKATEDYSAFASKHVEELEHMVELYDFPATLETHDIISAFSLLNSESMYVRWVDDTRALLVLGSSIQAQKAMQLSNPLIKVRPMSAASSLALEKAHQSDLKPAMKRPQTNLQTARRLITSHLGAKTKVSKEQSEKEREDLKVAKEMKKQAKQNEKDAWEGKLRSAIH